MSNVVYLSNCQAHGQASTAPDTRADGGSRNIYLDQRCIRIERVVAGVKMRLAVPVAAYRGVVLSCEETADQRLYYVTLAHRDGEFSVVLHAGTDWTDVLAIWQRWAKFFSQPAIFNDDPGASEKPLRAAQPMRQRRRSAALAQRRPRFLMRRRQGRCGPPVNMLEGARELISYE